MLLVSQIFEYVNSADALWLSQVFENFNIADTWEIHQVLKQIENLCRNGAQRNSGQVQRIVGKPLIREMY